MVFSVPSIKWVVYTNGTVSYTHLDVYKRQPPYCVDDKQLALLACVTRAAIDEATACA